LVILVKGLSEFTSSKIARFLLLEFLGQLLLFRKRIDLPQTDAVACLLNAGAIDSALFTRPACSPKNLARPEGVTSTSEPLTHATVTGSLVG
jgi:hypothetical protein